MYHPTTLTMLSEQRQDELMRESSRRHRTDRAAQPMGNGIVNGFVEAHPRIVTATATLLLAFGLIAAL